LNVVPWDQQWYISDVALTVVRVAGYLSLDVWHWMLIFVVYYLELVDRVYFPTSDPTPGAMVHHSTFRNPNSSILCPMAHVLSFRIPAGA